MPVITETYTAELCSRTYAGTANRYPNSSGTESPAATHGYYSSNGNWIGMVLLPVNLKDMRVEAVTLTLTANTAGTTSGKTVYIYSSNYQTTDAEGTGSIYPDEQLGSISGAFRNTTTEVELEGSLLESVGEYFAAGNQMLILYDPTASSSNYCRFTQILITVTYRNANTIMYNHNGEWIECDVYYQQGGEFIQVNPYYKYDGAWIECSSE